MAYDAFLKLDTIKGESQDKTHPNELEIMSFSFGAHNPTTIGSSTSGAGAGKVTFGSFSFTKKLDSSSPLLFQACAQGTHIKTGALTLRKAGENPLEYLKFKFATVFVESIQWSGASGGDDSVMESCSFVYGEKQVDYQAQDDKGKASGAAIHGGYSVVNNKPV